MKLSGMFQALTGELVLFGSMAAACGFFLVSVYFLQRGR